MTQLFTAQALFAHHPSAMAIVEATATMEYCQVCGLALRNHPRCFWCGLLLGPEHIENVPVGWAPGDRRALECDYCWLVRMRRLKRVAS